LKVEENRRTTDKRFIIVTDLVSRREVGRILFEQPGFAAGPFQEWGSIFDVGQGRHEPNYTVQGAQRKLLCCLWLDKESGYRRVSAVRFVFQPQGGFGKQAPECPVTTLGRGDQSPDAGLLGTFNQEF